MPKTKPKLRGKSKPAPHNNVPAVLPAGQPAALLAAFRLPAREAPAGDDDQLLDTIETARWLGCSTKWLEAGRSSGNSYGPPCIKVTRRLIRYRRGDLVAYLKGRTSTPAES